MNMSSIKIPDLSFLNKDHRVITYNKSKDYKYDYVSTLGLLTSFFIVLLLFLLVAINNMWVFIGFFVIVVLILLWNSINQNTRMYPVIVLIIVGILIVSWQYRNKIKTLFHKKQKEEFYTLFTPFQPYPGTKPPMINTVALSNTTTDLLKYRVKNLRYGYQLSDTKTATFLAKLVLSKSKISNISLKHNSSYENLCYKLHNNDLDTALIPAPIVNKGYMGYLPGYIGNHMKNLQFIANIQRQYLFCISSIKSGVQNIHQLRNRRVGIISRIKCIWEDIVGSLFPGGHSVKVTYDNQYKLVQDLTDFKIDAIFYSGQYPNQFINDIVSSEVATSYQLLPVVLQNENEFLTRNNHYKKYILDVDYGYMPSQYLPTGLGRMWKSNYTPEYSTIGFYLTLVCNNNLDYFTGYEIARTNYRGRQLLLRNTNISHLIYIGDPFTPADIASPSLPKLYVQKGAKDFYITRGVISYCKDPICMTSIGHKECTACNKKEYDYDTKMKYKDIIISEK